MIYFQTKDERSKSDRIKEKRKAALAARLAKVKQRKREKLGLPEPDEGSLTHYATVACLTGKMIYCIM